MSDTFEIIYRTSQGEGSPGTAPPAGGYTGTTPETGEQIRLGCAYKALSDAEQISGRFGLGTTDTDRTAFSLILGVEEAS